MRGGPLKERALTPAPPEVPHVLPAAKPAKVKAAPRIPTEVRAPRETKTSVDLLPQLPRSGQRLLNVLTSTASLAQLAPFGTRGRSGTKLMRGRASALPLLSIETLRKLSSIKALGVDMPLTLRLKRR